MNLRRNVLDQESELRRVGIKFSLRVKLIVGFTIVLTIVFIAAYLWFNQYARNIALNRIQEDLQVTLEGALDGVKGDEFESLVREAIADGTGVPSQDIRYQNHMAWLMTVLQIEPRAYSVCTYIKGGANDQILWVGDTYRVTDPGSATRYLEPYTRTEGSFILEGFVQNTNKMVIYDDVWGTWVSAYGPIENSQGEVVGALGIDFKAAYVHEVEQRVQRSILIGSILTYIVLIFIVFFISLVLTRPLVRLAIAARHIGEGDYKQDLSSLFQTRLQDEIDALARDFASMVSKVYQREQTLRMEVQQLRIEIDKTKQQKQVDEIVESDFFKDLQNKAGVMRRRSQRSSESPAS